METTTITPSASRAVLPGHNSPLDNARFKLAWNETNYRYLLGDTPRDEAKIARALKWIEEVKAEIAALESCNT